MINPYKSLEWGFKFNAVVGLENKLYSRCAVSIDEAKLNSNIIFDKNILHYHIVELIF